MTAVNRASVMAAPEPPAVVDHPPLKMQSDRSHMARMNDPLATALRDNINAIGHIQFADVPNRHQPFTGNLPFAALFELIGSLNYHGYCGAEYHPTGHTLDSLDWFQPYRRLP